MDVIRPALFADAAGLAVANIYSAQPLLDTLASRFAIDPGSAGIVLTVTQVGYALGLLALVPLGDVVDRRRLIVALLALSAVALALVGGAWSREVLLAGMAAVGLLAVVAQVLVAYAAALARPHERGRVVGAVTSGIVVGIVLARTVSGLVTELIGWRAVYLGSAVLTVVVVAALVRGLPADDRPRRTAAPPSRAGSHAATRRPPVRNRTLLRSAPRVRGRLALLRSAPRVRGRLALLRSSLALYREAPELRLRGTLALLSFAGLSVLWASLALKLAGPPLSLSTAAIGAFGLAGAAGAPAAARAGRLADRGHGERTTGLALAALLVAWLPLAFVEQSLLALVAGLVALEVAVQAVHVSNQSILYASAPESRSRLAGGYMVFYSVGTAAGSIASTATYAAAGWTGVCALGAAIGAAALAIWASVRLRSSSATSSSSRASPTPR